MTVKEVDPIRLLDFATVVERTGYSRSYILQLLAKDEAAKFPNRSFPAPLKRPPTSGGKARLYWRELRIVEWIESMEVTA